MPENPEEKDDEIKKIDLKSLTTPEEFRAFGLNKLSTGELQLLNAWLNMNEGKLFPRHTDDPFPPPPPPDA